MERIHKISDRIIALFLSALYILIISGALDFDLISAFKNDFSDSNQFYYMIYFSYFFFTVLNIIENIFFRYRLTLIEIEKKFDDQSVLNIIWIILIIITHIIFMNNLFSGDYRNLIPSIVLLVVMIIQFKVSSGVFLTEHYFIANDKKYFYNRIKTALYKDPLQICIETEKKDYFIIALSNKKYDFIKSILDEHLDTEID